MNAIKDSVVVVAGGTGGVGEGLVRTFLERGARVVVPYRSDAKRERLEQYCADVAENRLHCIEAVLSDEASMERFHDTILSTHERVDLGVACIGGWYYGYSLHRMPFDHWAKVLENNLTTHFLTLRAVVSIMRANDHGTYVMVNGGAAEVIAPESGAVSIAAAAQKMMARVLAQEAHGTNVRVHSVIAYHPVQTRDRRGEVVEDWITPAELGAYIARLYETPGSDRIVHTVYSHTDVK